MLRNKLSTLTTTMKKLALPLALISVTSIAMTSNAIAQEDDWWFDVEFAVFKRTNMTDVKEDFTAGAFTPTEEFKKDLFILPLLQQTTPSGSRLVSKLDACDVKEEAVDPNDLSQDVATEPVSNDLSEVVEQSQTLERPDALVSLPLQRWSQLNSLLAQTRFESRLNCTKPPISFSNDSPIAEGMVNDESLSDAVKGVITQFSTPFEFETRLLEESEKTTITQVPLSLFSQSEYVVGTDAVLPSEYLNMQDFVEDVFKQRGITPLLYTVWRQQVVFGEENAEFIKIYAGEKIIVESQSETISEDEEPLDDVDSFQDVFTQIKQELDTPERVNWFQLDEEQDQEKRNEGFNGFEIEGAFKVYLQYVGRIPYLHIDSEFYHHRLALTPSGTPKVESYPFKQRRRIISRQIHYFDHPAFGIVVRLNRYEPPAQPETTVVGINEDLY